MQIILGYTHTLRRVVNYYWTLFHVKVPDIKSSLCPQTKPLRPGNLAGKLAITCNLIIHVTQCWQTSCNLMHNVMQCQESS